MASKTSHPVGYRTDQPLLEVQDLQTHLQTDAGVVRAVDGVSLTIRPNETLGLVGESGCGKSMLALSVMRLVPEPPGRIVAGRILYSSKGEGVPPVDLAGLNPHGQQIRAIRGKDIAIVFQEPMTSLSPVHTVGNQIVEVIRLHQHVGKREARESAIELLAKVRLPKPERQIDAYPHELSGGMRQRAMIAMALACTPNLLIADEPTTALDVTVQAEILELIRALQNEIGMALMLITHDLGVVARMADRIAVMYCGKVVEQADVRTLFRNPLHPYTRGLLKSLPRLGHKERLVPIKGSVPDPYRLPAGCAFGRRCPVRAWPGWESVEPPLIEVEPGHFTRCCGTCAEGRSL